MVLEGQVSAHGQFLARRSILGFMRKEAGARGMHCTSSGFLYTSEPVSPKIVSRSSSGWLFILLQYISHFFPQYHSWVQCTKKCCLCMTPQFQDVMKIRTPR